MVARYFTIETVHLLASLKKNNNREWYHQNKSRLEDFVLAPARELVVNVGHILGKQIDGLVADPRVDHSIYRLHRDTRFSKDKTPFKEHLGIIWWQDLPEGKLSSPCFYFHFTSEGWQWSAGCYRFTPALLTAFRQSILDPEHGTAFKFIAAGLRHRGLEFNPPDLKRDPTGYSGPEWTSEWLRRKGLYTWSQCFPVTDADILGPKAAQFLAKKFNDALPIHIWLTNLFERGRVEEGGLKIPFR
ncbi:MAG: DUF2461 domain-containing protein [Deltaproteobacteria bacterium]|nr:DUF2461 domain-containing protein [Deltaproteobacteria bacterium]